MPGFELVVPAYNEAKNLPLLLQKVADAARGSGLRPDDFQLVVVENGSVDDSAKVLQQAKESDLGIWFRVVSVPVNQGYGYGLKCGLASTTAEVIGWSHADLQCDPKDALTAWHKVRQAQGEIVVKGRRYGRGWKDWVVSRIFESLALMLLGLSVFDINAQPKVMRRSLLAAIHSPPNTFGFDLYALYAVTKAGAEILSIPVAFPSRVHGVSHWASNFFSRYRTMLGLVRYMWQLSRAEGRV